MAKETPRPPVEIQNVEHKCECGKTHKLRVAHYEKVMLPCDLLVWALQPQRNGSFKMFKHPGERKKPETASTWCG